MMARKECVIPVPKGGITFGDAYKSLPSKGETQFKFRDIIFMGIFLSET